MSSARPVVLVLSGPTGVGKTAVAHRLAALLDTELISCDSVQVYKELTVGSNKDTTTKQHLVDVISWRDKTFSNAAFYQLCMDKIYELVGKGKVPILVGGTGFYTKWILEGRPRCPPPTPETLLRVEKLLENKSWAESIEILAESDPEYASSLYKNDFYRLKRALANSFQTQKCMSFFTKELERNHFDFRCFYLSKDRWLLSESIDLRCELMIEKGLLREVGQLWLDGMKKDSPAGRAIGYGNTITLIEELWASFKSVPCGDDLTVFFSRSTTLASFRKYLLDFKASSRQYARRQDSWHRNASFFRWLNPMTIANDRRDADENSLLADFIFKMVKLPLEEWDSNQTLISIHHQSLELRWNDAVRKKMRTRPNKSGELFSVDTTCSRLLSEHLGPFYYHRYFNFQNLLDN